MYQPMLFMHWKEVRVALIPFIIASFGLPLLTVQGLGMIAGQHEVATTAFSYLNDTQALALFPFLAGAIGVTLGLSSWNWDHQLNHVYALSLPISRWQYAALKMGAGATLAFLPAGALWVGALAASASVTLPPGLHAYPTLLAIRFLAAILVSYAVLFAMAAGTIRTTAWILGGILTVVILSVVADNYLAEHFALFYRMHPLDAILEALIRAPGPFQIFTGNWGLIDV